MVQVTVLAVVQVFEVAASNPYRRVKKFRTSCEGGLGQVKRYEGR